VYYNSRATTDETAKKDLIQNNFSNSFREIFALAGRFVVDFTQTFPQVRVIL